MKGTTQGLDNMRLLLDSVCLRRTKKLLDLPDISDEDRFIELSHAEKTVYNAIQMEMIKAIKQQDSQARNAKGYFGIFQLQLQLRRTCNHGTFQKSVSKPSESDLPFEPEEAFSLLQQRQDAKCSYCQFEVTHLEDAQAIVSGSFTVCGHLLCSSCLLKFQKGLQKANEASLHCPICFKDIPKNFVLSRDVHGRDSNPVPPSKVFEYNGVSSKISTLVKDIRGSHNMGKRHVFQPFDAANSDSNMLTGSKYYFLLLDLVFRPRWQSS
jgi:SWI/SNF-related matrix-associated actin-dependent regulator of chromatin subfamily A3